MRYCPTCRTQYTDDTLRFCLQDGSMLVESIEGEAPAALSDETPTVVRRPRPQVTVPQSEPVTQATIRNPNSRRRLVMLPLVAIVAILIVGLLVGAIGVWFYLNSGSGVAANSANLSPPQTPGSINRDSR